MTVNLVNNKWYNRSKFYLYRITIMSGSSLELGDTSIIWRIQKGKVLYKIHIFKFCDGDPSTWHVCIYIATAQWHARHSVWYELWSRRGINSLIMTSYEICPKNYSTTRPVPAPSVFLAFRCPLFAEWLLVL